MASTELRRRSISRTALELATGDLELFFHENASRWEQALQTAETEIAMTERAGAHGDASWREELPLMIGCAFGQ